MNRSISYKRSISGDMESIIKRTTEELSKVGFGVLSRYDMHNTFKTKINKDFAPCTILAVCHPEWAFKMLSINTDVSAVMPCNAVIREVTPGEYSVEFSKATVLVDYIGDKNITSNAEEVDSILKAALDNI